MMDITIRILKGNDGAVDWTVNSKNATFREAVEVIRRVFRHCTMDTAFEYEDEEGDRVTVRSEEEMMNMLNFHTESRLQGGAQYLVIYPRASKPPSKRNLHGLRVETSASVEEDMDFTNHGSGSRKQQSQDLQEILAVGTNISESDLQCLDLLGEGNIGRVYRAFHRKSGTAMAVKVIRLEVTTDFSEKQKQIESELQVLHKCRSPVIIGYYGAFFVENKISICTEYMDGGSLDKYGKIVEQVLGRMAVAVIKGLDYLWGLKILHRDVKPSNILVNTCGQVKLCDFNVSVQLLTLTFNAKTVIGTHAYMSPERLRGEDYTVHSDVWSLGVSLFELAEGVFPYDIVPDPGRKSSSALEPDVVPAPQPVSVGQVSAQTTTVALMHSIVYKEAPQLMYGNFSHELVDFINSCLKKDANLRPLPEDLMRHPLTKLYDDGNMEIVAKWVCVKLEELRSREKDAA